MTEDELAARRPDARRDALDTATEDLMSARGMLNEAHAQLDELDGTERAQRALNVALEATDMSIAEIEDAR